MEDQSMRLYNLNPARGGSSVFRIVLNNGGKADEFEDQVARGFVRSERINRADHHCDLRHDAEIYQKGLKITSSEMRRNIARTICLHAPAFVQKCFGRLMVSTMAAPFELHLF
jgi:hypothetical protein